MRCRFYDADWFWRWMERETPRNRLHQERQRPNYDDKAPRTVPRELEREPEEQRKSACQEAMHNAKTISGKCTECNRIVAKRNSAGLFENSRPFGRVSARPCVPIQPLLPCPTAHASAFCGPLLPAAPCHGVARGTRTHRAPGQRGLLC